METKKLPKQCERVDPPSACRVPGQTGSYMSGIAAGLKAIWTRTASALGRQPDLLWVDDRMAAWVSVCGSEPVSSDLMTIRSQVEGGVHQAVGRSRPEHPVAAMADW